MNLDFMAPIKASELGIEHMKLSAVWTWAKDLHESEDSLIPVPLEERAIAEAETLLIHSRFRTASGKALEGVVIYQIATDEVFAIEVIIGQQRFTFNKHVPDMSKDELLRLAEFTGELPEDTLPITYEIVPLELAIETGRFSFLISK